MILILALVSQVQTNMLPHKTNDAPNSVDGLVDKLATMLVDKLTRFKTWPLHHASLDNTSMALMTFRTDPRRPAPHTRLMFHASGFPVSLLRSPALAVNPPLPVPRHLLPYSLPPFSFPYSLPISSGPPQALPGPLQTLLSLESLFQDKEESPASVASACSTDDQKVLDDDGKQLNMGFGCAGSALNARSFRIDQSKLATCLTRELSIGTECSVCLATGIQYAFNHCNMECGTNQLSDECLTCFAGSNIEGCAQDSAWLGLAWLVGLAVQRPLKVRLGSQSQGVASLTA
eukprot:gnl/MRDRNA2_/MRDRNA2_154423_c0_seq1.p1 gnl/MRDRNA2_/MRDRNA2_154423_c0~~gnl/MRDRNA2_/MRDRNA2_154423_c0_seq1.p1  ORF type:complete len:289 (+),score=30.18 gnl/MRDRNA2_/MRDRNA2_154423_c0_seq1:129-995(+)